MKIETFFSGGIPQKKIHLEKSVAICIDVLRAGTSVCEALQNGAKKIMPASTFEEAEMIYNSIDKKEKILAGERRGIKPPGFDLGNSPSEFSRDKVNGKTVVMTTSNGTRIFKLAAKAVSGMIGGFVNKQIVVNKVMKSINENKADDVIILCAGTDGEFSDEDAMAAGMFVSEFNKNLNLENDNNSCIALELYENNRKNMFGFLKNTKHAVYLKKIGVEKDIDFALEINKIKTLPVIYHSGFIIKG